LWLKIITEYKQNGTRQLIECMKNTKRRFEEKEMIQEKCKRR
jgi:hypothetical protein